MRKLSPYEQTHLHRFGKADVNLDEYGQMPVEYITGKVEFNGHIFSVNQDVLIPRVETEILVKLAIKALPTTPSIADIGTGCGAVGISIASQLIQDQRNFSLLMSDISPEAVAMAKQNWQTIIQPQLASSSHSSAATTQFVVSDLLSAIQPAKPFDLIVANLPYIPSKRVALLDSSVKDYEPHLALDGGVDGLQYIRQLIKQSDPFLHPGSVILLEVDYLHTQEVLQQHLPLENFSLHTHFDQFERTRFAELTYQPVD